MLEQHNRVPDACRHPEFRKFPGFSRHFHRGNPFVHTQNGGGFGPDYPEEKIIVIPSCSVHPLFINGGIQQAYPHSVKSRGKVFEVGNIGAPIPLCGHVRPKGPFSGGEGTDAPFSLHIVYPRRKQFTECCFGDSVFARHIEDSTQKPNFFGDHQGKHFHQYPTRNGYCGPIVRPHQTIHGITGEKYRRHLGVYQDPAPTADD